MATIRGAEAVGMDGDIGSIEAGKLADLVIHDPTSPQWFPRGDTALQLVWSADGRTVRDVLVGGKTVVRDRRCVTVDLVGLRDDAQEASMKLLARAGIDVPHQWPHIPAG